jgi:hypothetical protein
MKNTTERLDVASREMCRLFADDDRVGVLAQMLRLKNHTEAALVAASAASRMAPETRKSFLKFLELQARSLDV